MKIAEIADQIIEAAQKKRRHIVAIAGPPGSGKSTLSEALHSELLGRGFTSKIVPMDGFHLDNTVLEERGLLSRKGAPETFDLGGFTNLVSQLTSDEDYIAFPVFDRDEDATIEGDEFVGPSDQVLLVEGNYLLLEKTPWSKLEQFWDQSIFIATEFEELEKRLIKRWLDQGLEVQAAKERAFSNDLQNARLVLDNSTTADIQLT